MKDRTFRLRRAAVTLTLGVGAIGGVIASTSGVAAAAVTSNSALGSGSGITASANPTLAATGASQSAGNLAITLGPGTNVNTGDELRLTLVATGGGTVDWSAAPTVTPSGASTATAGAPAGAGTSTLLIPLAPVPGQDPSTAAETFALSSITYTTANASGPVQVTAQYLGQTTTGTAVGAYTANIGTAVNATIPAPAAAFTLSALSAPAIGAGQNSQAGGNWALTIGGPGNSWTAGDQYAVTVNDTTGANCTSTDYVYFAATPTVTVTSSSALSTVPTFTTSLGYSGACGPTDPNSVIITFTNSGTVNASAGTNTGDIVISGVSYNVGSTTPSGPLSVSAAYGPSGSMATTTAASTAGPPGPSNGDVSPVIVTANSPAVTSPPSGLNVSISPVNISEAQAGKIPSGYVCLTLGSGSFSTGVVPKASASGGNGAVSTAPMTFTSVDTASTGSNATANNTAVFQVTTPSTGTAGTTYTVSGAAVDAPASAGAVKVYVTTGAASPATCGSTGTVVNATGTTAYTVSSANNVIYGANADATAVAELEHEFPAAQGACPATGSVVLATDSNYPDALAGAYLARYLGTGELLTPTDSLSPEAMTALRIEGIQNVYIVGGPIAVSSSVSSQLAGTQAYTCGGNTGLTTATGSPMDLQVTRIYGQTEYGTAQQIAQFVPASYVGSASVAGAYAGVNSSAGNGMYNDTSGNGSPAPLTTAPLRTAVLATGQTWQDAESASAMAYAQRFPILITNPSTLSPEVTAAITNLGIQQVIVMGGPIAISNADVTTLMGMGVSVLRVAGQDYTDTATQLANFEVGQPVNGVSTGLSWDPQGSITVARGDFYTDGLAGAVVSANGATPYTAGTSPGLGNPADPVCTTNMAAGTHCAQPLLLTFDPSSLGNYLPPWLGVAGSSAGINKVNAAGNPNLSGDSIGTINVLGGPLAVTPSQISAMQSDL